MAWNDPKTIGEVSTKKRQKEGGRKDIDKTDVISLSRALLQEIAVDNRTSFNWSNEIYQNKALGMETFVWEIQTLLSMYQTQGLDWDQNKV